MPRVVLVDSFVDAAVEREVMLIAFQTCKGAKDAISAGEFVDTGCDGEVVHRFHLAGAKLEENVFVPRGVEIGALECRHGCVVFLVWSGNHKDGSLGGSDARTARE